MPTLWLGRDVGQPADEGAARGANTGIDVDKLVTHAACIGMTGSGKTGLCIGLLEEVAAAGVPIVAIDPKGDLANLALDEPSPEAAAAWREGQAKWGLDAGGVAAWRAKVHTRLWTPGSEAGVGVNVLSMLAPPEAATDAETLRALLTGTVSALLGLVGIASDPVRTPAHVVLTRILGDAWTASESPTLELLVERLVAPPFKAVGVFPVAKFFPEDDRMDIAMRFNALLASPAFASWTTGAHLDVPAMLAPVAGKTVVNVFSIAHLSDAERHFFVGLLLERIAAWTRTLPGTHRLRALVFFDEIWGFLPPHPKNPPSKTPLLTLLKQARAVGVGVILATQNPVDIDYKALSNCGTWMVGRLQTKNDRDRVREGMGIMDAAEMDAILDGLGDRRFLLTGHGAPRTFVTRWTRVFLAGPLPRQRIRALLAAQVDPLVASLSRDVPPAAHRGTQDPAAVVAREARVTARIDKLTASYAKKVAAAEEKLRRATARSDEAKSRASSRQTEEWLNAGQTLLSFFGGRKKSLTTLATKRRQALDAGARVETLEGDVASAEAALAALRDELAAAAASARAEEGT